MTGKLVAILAALMLSICPVILCANELEIAIGALSQDETLSDNADAIYSLRIGSGPRRPLSGETTFAYSPSEYFDVFFIEGNFNINLPVMPNIVPYVTLGPGTVIYVPKDKVENELDIALNTTVTFALNYGGGVRYFFNDSVGLRGDFRDHVVFNLEFETDPENPNVDIGNSHLIELALGLSVAFF